MLSTPQGLVRMDPTREAAGRVFLLTRPFLLVHLFAKTALGPVPPGTTDWTQTVQRRVGQGPALGH